jgi:hypothetical protein
VPPVPVPTARVAAPGGRPAPRPAEYGDLLRFGLRVARAALGAPACLLSRVWAAGRR